MSTHEDVLPVPRIIIQMSIPVKLEQLEPLIILKKYLGPAQVQNKGKEIGKGCQTIEISQNL